MLVCHIMSHDSTIVSRDSQLEWLKAELQKSAQHLVKSVKIPGRLIA